MTARSAMESLSPVESSSALVFEPPDQLEGGAGLYHTVLRCGVDLDCEADLDRSDASPAGARQAAPVSASAPGPRGPGHRR